MLRNFKLVVLNTLSRKGRSSLRRSRGLAATVPASAAIERLEDRSLLASVTWVGGTSSVWSVGANWDGGEVPTAADDVTISNGVTVLVDGSFHVRSINIESTDVSFGNGGHTLTIDRDLTITSGTFSIGDGGIRFENGPWQVNAGGQSLGNVEIAGNPGTSDFSSPDAVVVNGDLTLTEVGNLNAVMAVQGDVTSNDSSVSGTGVIRMEGYDEAVITGGDFPDGGLVMNKIGFAEYDIAVTLSSDLNLASTVIERGALDVTEFRLTTGDFELHALGELRVHLESNNHTAPVEASGAVVLAGTISGTLEELPAFPPPDPYAPKTYASNFDAAIGDTYAVIDNTGTAPISGLINTEEHHGQSLVGDMMFTPSETGGDGNDLFLVAPGGFIVGTVWDDQNADGERQPDEPGMAGVTIYLDENENEQFDANEPWVVTAADDPMTDENEEGTYSFSGLSAGEYVVRQAAMSNTAQTYPIDPAFVSSGQPIPNMHGSDAALGDVDGDGDLDAFIANVSYTSNYGSRVFINHDGLFRDTGERYLAGVIASHVELRNFDGDDDLEVLVSGAGGTWVYDNDGDGVFINPQRLGYTFPGRSSVGDLNEDGHLDIVIELHKPFFNDGTGHFEHLDVDGPIPPRWGPSVIGDVDGDEINDVVVGGGGANNIWLNPMAVWTNQGGTTGELLMESETADVTAVDIEMWDLNGDTHNDLIVAGTGHETIWLNDGAGEFSHYHTIERPGNSHTLVLGYLNDDAHIDYFSTDLGLGNYVAFGNGDGTFNDSLREVGGPAGLGGDIGNVDDDDDNDILAIARGQVDTLWINAELPGDVPGYEIKVNQSFQIRHVDFGLRSNLPPIADAGTDLTVAEGQSVTLDASATTDPDEPADELTYEWDFDGDDITDATGVNPVFSAYQLDGSQTVTAQLTVTDAGGATDITTVDITVLNVDPVITSVSSTSADCGDAVHGETVSVLATFSDDGLPDTHTALVDWGDGTVTSAVVTQNTGSGSIAATHVYPNGGIYEVNLTVIDDDYGSATATTTTINAGAGLVDGTLNVIGTNHSDDILLRFGAVLTVDMTLGDADPLSIQFDPQLVQNVVVHLCDNDDSATATGFAAADVSLTMFGGNGDDNLTGGRGDDNLFGGSGDDTISGGRGDDLLIGDLGDDVLLGGVGDDELHGGSGDDDLKGSRGQDRLFGGNGHDILSGGRDDDELYGGSGDDELSGGRGDDDLFGESGEDDIRGGRGDDLIDGGADGDILRGGRDNDIVLGGGGEDLLRGDLGNDVLIGGTGSDELRGGNGDDILIGGFTAYDSDRDTLRSILVEWSSPTDYIDRVATLADNTGPALLGSAASVPTVFDDAVTDHLRGGNGTDWYLASTSIPEEEDDVFGLLLGEILDEI